MKLLQYLIGLVAIIVLVLFGFTILNEARTTAQPRDQRSYRLDEAALANAINSELAAQPKLDVSVSLVDLQTGRHYHYGDTSSYGSASIGKLVSAAAYLQKIELGQASLDDLVGAKTGRQQLELMITKSDNTAWHDINQLVTADGLKAFTASIGLNSYEPTENLLISDDVAVLLDKLASYQLLTNDHTDLLLSLMEQANMRDYIVAGTPAGAVTYHKVGYLQDRLHEAAIIHKGDRAFALVIFSKSAGMYDFSKGSALFQAITKQTAPIFFED
jgi:beta-lactamase class A